MESLNYFESCLSAQIDYLRKSYDDLHERAYKFAMLLVAGGGAVGAYALAAFSKSPHDLFGWAPSSGLALTWFGTAGLLIWYGAMDRELPSGANLQSLRDRYQYELGAAGADESKALDATREAALIKRAEHVQTFSTGCNDRTGAIEIAYKVTIICSPLVPILISVACYYFAK